MNHPCPVKPNCIAGDQFLGQDTPFANLSAELPDVDLFLGSNFGWDLNVPRLDWTFTDTDTPFWCRGVTQEAADLCAANQQLTGQLGTWKNQNGFPPPLFFNQTVTCPFACPDGLQFVWTVLAGTVQAMDQATANSIAQSIACQNALKFAICMGSLTATGCVGTPYSSTLAFPKGTTPLAVDVDSGILPPGILMVQDPKGTTATFSGTPTAAGNFAFSIRATDPQGNFMVKQFNISILGITNLASLPQPIIARAYSAQLVGGGASGHYTFSVAQGTLPDGLTVSSSGLISGTPDIHYTGAFGALFTITDTNGQTCTQTWNSKTQEPPGPDWTTLTWTTYQLNQGVPANDISGQGSGPNAFAGLTLNSGAANLSISPVLTGGVAYTGPMVNCEMQVIVTNWTPLATATFRPIHSVAGQLAVGGGPINGPGTYNLTFTIPASAGATIHFDDGSPGNEWAEIPLGAYMGSPLKVNFTWQVFNL
jgi:hypothetical protein